LGGGLLLAPWRRKRVVGIAVRQGHVIGVLIAFTCSSLPGPVLVRPAAAATPTPTNTATHTPTASPTPTPTATRTTPPTSPATPPQGVHGVLLFRARTRGDTTPAYAHTDSSTTEARQTFQLPAAATLSNLYVRCEVAQTGAAQTFTLRVGGSDTALG